MGRKYKIEVVRDLLKFEKPTILLIQETKLEDGEILQIGSKQWKESQEIAVSSKRVSKGICTL